MKRYETPNCSISEFELCDILRTSGGVSASDLQGNPIVKDIDEIFNSNQF